MKGNHTTNKISGSPLTATDWNNLASDVNDLVSNSGSNNSGSGVVSVSAKGNTEITSQKHINLEPAYADGTYGDIQMKPGDDITLESSHRAVDKQDEISIKAVDGNKTPVKLQVKASEITLSTKDKTGNNANVMDVNITQNNGKGYLKVRAQAIDLRCEEHGGIALQPMGYDGDGNMNKIKFEHGGGDGLEFGTFNTEHSSLYTNDYRFKKDGIIRLATRATTPSGKSSSYDNTPAGKTATYANKYVKQADDFYDIINSNDPTCTWNDIVVAVNYLKNQLPSLNWSQAS